jgi:GNAT superfamily N-acetyltransferase
MYPAEIPRGQANELTRLEQKDLESRYGDLVGKRKYPSVFLVAEEDQEFLGAVGLDCQYFDAEENKFQMFKPSRADQDRGGQEIVVVLANLTVRRDRRKKGIAKKLVLAAEQFVRTDIAPTGLAPAIYLLVESENIAAQNLYKKLGYKLHFVDEAATCVVSGEYNLKTQECVNYCFKKTITASPSGGGGGGAGANLGGFLNSIFGKK